MPRVASLAGQALSALSATAWTSSLRVIGRAGPSPRTWTSRGGLRALVIAPHPDDETAGCGGTILLHRAAGDEVTVVHVTDGRLSRALGIGADAMATRRRSEASASTRLAEVNRWEWLGLREGDWSDGELQRPLDTLLREIKPQIVYAPSRVDFHPEHRRVARVLAQSPALLDLREALVRIYQVNVPLTQVLVNLVAPIESVMPLARLTAEQYESQGESLRGPLRLKRYAAATCGCRVAAEEFWELSPARYASLHEEPPRPLPSEPFRGLRRLAMTDPLAFTRGRTERRRLRGLAGG